MLAKIEAKNRSIMASVMCYVDVQNLVYVYRTVYFTTVDSIKTLSTYHAQRTQFSEITIQPIEEPQYNHFRTTSVDQKSHVCGSIHDKGY